MCRALPTCPPRRRALACFGDMCLELRAPAKLPEELRGARRGQLYLTCHQIIFHHKAKDSTTIWFPLKLLGVCAIGEEPSTKQQHIKGTLTSMHGVLSFKFIFSYGSSSCPSLIQDLCSSDALREAVNLQQCPTASIFSYACPPAPHAQRMLPVIAALLRSLQHVAVLATTLSRPEAPPPYSEVDPANPRERCCCCSLLKRGQEDKRD